MTVTECIAKRNKVIRKKSYLTMIEEDSSPFEDNDTEKNRKKMFENGSIHTRNSLISSREEFEIKKNISSSNLLAIKNDFITSTLTMIYFGKVMEILFILLNSISLYGLLSAFVIVFASSLATVSPVVNGSSFSSASVNDGYDSYVYNEKINYNLYIAVFTIIIMPSICFDIKKCWVFLYLLSSCRILVILLMTITSVNANFYGLNAFQNQNHDHFHQDYFTQAGDNFIFKGLHLTLPIIIFATTLHCPDSGLSAPTANKRFLRSTFIISLCIWGFILSFFGVSVAWTFKINSYRSFNLNWICFVKFSSSEKEDNHELISSSLLLKYFSMFILYFPAFDMISAFRIKSIALANNLIKASYFPVVQNETYQDEERCCHPPNWIIITFRIIAAIPPIIGAYLIRDLGTVSDYTGIVLVLVEFAFPAAIYIESKRLAALTGIVLPKYRGFVTSSLWAWIILLFCVFVFVCIFCFLMGEP